jgi:hypothetical protein
MPERTHPVYPAAGGENAPKCACVCVKLRESERARERESERAREKSDGGGKREGARRERESEREGGRKSSCRNKRIYTIPGTPGYDRLHEDISVYSHGVACVEICV